MLKRKSQMELLTESHLPLKLVASGKVRDIYEVDDDHLLLITTDRVSAFDVVMNEAVPYKGAVLTALSAWWFSQFGNLIDHHMVSVRTDDIIEAAPGLAPHRSTIVARAMLCRRLQMIPIECVVRGYLSSNRTISFETHTAAKPASEYPDFPGTLAENGSL
jgi:phosphoribosylaminoimidazole-succinocarboxamide synthase